MESLKNIIPKNGVFVKYVHGFSGKNEIFVIVFKWGSEYFVGFCRKMRAGYGFGSWTGRERRGGSAVAGRIQRSAVEDEGGPHLAGWWKVSVLCLFKIGKCTDFCITYGKKRYVWGIWDGFGAEYAGRRERKFVPPGAVFPDASDKNSAVERGAGNGKFISSVAVFPDFGTKIYAVQSDVPGRPAVENLCLSR